MIFVNRDISSATTERIKRVKMSFSSAHDIIETGKCLSKSHPFIYSFFTPPCLVVVVVNQN